MSLKLKTNDTFISSSQQLAQFALGHHLVQVIQPLIITYFRDNLIFAMRLAFSTTMQEENNSATLNFFMHADEWQDLSFSLWLCDYLYGQVFLTDFLV